MRYLYKFEDPKFPDFWTYFRYANGDEFFRKFDKDGKICFMKYIKSGNPVIEILKAGKLLVHNYEKAYSYEWSIDSGLKII